MNVLSAPTSLGNRPYESDGTARWTDRGPARLRDQNLVERLGARDLGDIPAAEYRDFIRPPGGIRNEDLVLDHVRRIAGVLQRQNDFTLILGGDCSVLLGSLLGFDRDRGLGLVYLDGHNDFNTEEISVTGAVAGMCLAQAIGRGRSELAHLGGSRPLVQEEHVIAVGVRDGNFEGTRIRLATRAEEVLQHLDGRRFFIHLDVDVLDPSFMPFVDSPEPGGLDPETLSAFLEPLVRHPHAVGMEVTIYDPRHDPDSKGAALITGILERAFVSS